MVRRMSSRRGAALAALVCACASAPALAAGAPAAARTGGEGACQPAGAHLIYRHGLLHVYTSALSSRPARGPVEACLTGYEGHMTLLRAAGRPDVSLKVAATSGPLVAYLLTTFGVDSASTVLRVADVPARRVLRELAIGNYVDGGILEREAPTRVVLGPEGAVAWIAASHGPDQRVSYAIRTAATIGHVETLEEGPGISPGRLRLSGGRISWWHGGAERHGPLA
jgi:hypothetical protein